MITPFTKEVAVFEPVQKGTKPVQMFRCSDGQEFDDETKANRHEEEVEKENKKKQAWAALEKLENRESCELFDSLLGCSGDYRPFYKRWIRFKSVEEVTIFIQSITTIFQYFSRKTTSLHNMERYPINKWVLIILEADDVSDYYGSYANVHSDEYVKGLIKDMSDNIPAE